MGVNTQVGSPDRPKFMIVDSLVDSEGTKTDFSTVALQLMERMSEDFGLEWQNFTPEKVRAG